MNNSQNENALNMLCNLHKAFVLLPRLHPATEGGVSVRLELVMDDFPLGL